MNYSLILELLKKQGFFNQIIEKINENHRSLKTFLVNYVNFEINTTINFDKLYRPVWLEVRTYMILYGVDGLWFSRAI